MTSLNKLFEGFRSFLSEEELIESRKSDTIKKYPHLKNQIQQFADNDPSGKNKYLMWMTKMLDGMVLDDTEDRDKSYLASQILDIVSRFHKNQQRLSKKDINQYKSAADLKNAVNALGATSKEKRRQEKETAMEGSEIVWDDDGIFIVRPDTTEASCYYGKQTRWCISAINSRNYFDEYTSEGKAFYMVRLDNLEENDDEKKMALVYNDSGDLEEVYNAPDDSIDFDDARDAIGRHLFGKGDSDYMLTDEEEEQTEEYWNNLLNVITEHVHDNPVQSGPSTEEQCEEIEHEYNRESIGRIGIHYDIDDYSDLQEYVYYSGYAKFSLSSYKWAVDPDEHYEEIETAIKDAIEYEGIEYQDIQNDQGAYKVGEETAITFDLSFSSDDYDETPNSDGFRNFTYRMLNYERMFQDAENRAINTLEAKGIISPGPHRKGAKDLKIDAEQFRHVKVDIDEDDGELTVSVPIKVTFPQLVDASPRVRLTLVRSAVRDFVKEINKVLDDAEKYAKKQLSLFERLTPGKVFQGRLKLIGFSDVTGDLEVEYELTSKYDNEITKEEMTYFIKYVHFLDHNHAKIEELFSKALKMQTDNHG